MKRFSKILCVVDPDKTMDTAIVNALNIARNHEAKITFISVVNDTEFLRRVFVIKQEYEEDLEKFVDSKRAAIEAAVRAISSYEPDDIVVSSGIGFIEIIRRVIHQRYDLVVKCAEDTDWIDRMLGSEDMHLLRKCPCPVLMLKPHHNHGFTRVLATVDVSDDYNELVEARVQDQLNQEVLEYSAMMSMPELTEFHIGCAWQAYGESFLRHGGFSRTPEQEVTRYVERVQQDCSNNLAVLVRKLEDSIGKQTVKDLYPKSHFVKGKASKEIPIMTDDLDIDLIVMGTVGRVGIPGLIIGNTAESILEQTRCSILAIKPAGFKSPVES